jgi:hypothetical protein
MYNEALVTMYSGFNPDSFWDPALYRVALEALAAKRDHARDNNIQRDNNNCRKSKDGNNRCSTAYSNDCRKGGATAAAAVVAVPTTTTMIPTTVKDSLAVKSEEKLECGLAKANREEERICTSEEAPLSSLTLADARMRMKKTVSFADDESETVDSDNDVVVMELRNVLAEQANMIEELSRLLDEDEDENND